MPTDDESIEERLDRLEQRYEQLEERFTTLQRWADGAHALLVLLSDGPVQYPGTPPVPPPPRFEGVVDELALVALLELKRTSRKTDVVVRVPSTVDPDGVRTYTVRPPRENGYLDTNGELVAALSAATA